jgi:hypothetical protein
MTSQRGKAGEDRETMYGHPAARMGGDFRRGPRFATALRFLHLRETGLLQADAEAKAVVNHTVSAPDLSDAGSH